MLQVCQVAIDDGRTSVRRVDEQVEATCFLEPVNLLLLNFDVDYTHCCRHCFAHCSGFLLYFFSNQVLSFCSCRKHHSRSIRFSSFFSYLGSDCGALVRIKTTENQQAQRLCRSGFFLVRPTRAAGIFPVSCCDPNGSLRRFKLRGVTLPRSNTTV